MTGSKIVETAEKYKNKKGSFFCREYGLNITCDWCVIYVWYVFKAAGASNLFCGSKKVASVPILDNWLRKHTKIIKNVKDAKAGDIVICTWSGGREHVEIVTGVKNGNLETIGGNTGSDNCRRSGVNYRSRPPKNVYAIYRPAYAEDKKKKDKQSDDKKIEQLARDVIKGKYGNGAERKKKLGLLYNKVQKRVNELLQED